MAENPRVNLALVNDIPDGNLEQGTIYMSPDISGNFIKVAVTDSSTVTIFDGSAYATKQQVIDNEYVVATALNDLNSRIDNIDVKLLTNITYSDLKALRDTSALVPGMRYRITDYECATSVENTSVGGHAFDIIVTADSSGKLNENARAIQNEGENYFDNANLLAWELKYAIDNDSVYSWASQDGKGVVYYMKDEFGNECGYDFKNIKFAFVDSSSALIDSSMHYYYTFTDASTDGDLSMKKDSSTICEKNRITAIDDGSVFVLPHTVFIASNSVFNNTIKRASNNVFGAAYNNDMGMIEDCVFDNLFDFNTVETALNTWFKGVAELNHIKYISNSEFGNNFAFNTIRYMSTTKAGDGFMLNDVGDYFINSSFGNNCFSNFFGPYSGTITAGNDFAENTMQNQCHHLTFGNGCKFNNMGTVLYVRMGNNCTDNFIGNGKYIYFGNSSNQGADWICGNRFEGITQYVYFYNTDSASLSNMLRKYHMYNICGTSDTWKSISKTTRNNSKETFVLTRPGYTTPAANSLIYVDPAMLPERTKGGTAGQILVKISGTDYDMGWRTVNIGSQIAYDSSNKVISLKDASGNVLGTPVDATDFIKDGMVSDVSVYDNNLVISFNTDAGKEDISIPLSHIFDSSNYVSQEEFTSAALATAAALNDLNDKIEDSTLYVKYPEFEDAAMTTAAALNVLNARTQDISSYVTRNELEEVELSTAMALNDLDARVEDASFKNSVLAENIDDMRLDITDLSTSISYINSSIAIIDASISALDTSISALDASVKRIDASVKIIDASVKRIDASVKIIDTSVRDMSTYIADISTRIDDNELIVASALSDLDSRIEDVSSRIGGGGNADLMTSVTYSELKALRDSSSLVPGIKYRITDYDTLISKQGADSMHHRFDLILTALSENSLSENCGAVQHDFSAEELQNVSADEAHYFDGCNLDAWQIKYSIDNDTDRFDWVYNGRNKDAVLVPLYFSSFDSLTQFSRDSSSDSSVSMNYEHWGNFIYAFTDWNDEKYYFDTSVLDGYNLCYYGYNSGYAPANSGYVTFTPSGFMPYDSDAVPASEYFNKEDFSFRITRTGNSAFDYVAFSRDERYDNLYAAQGYDTSSGWYAYSYTKTINDEYLNFVIWHNDSSVDDLVKISSIDSPAPIFYKEPSAVKITYPPYAHYTAVIDGETVSMDINYPEDNNGIIALCAEDTNDLNTWSIKNMPFGFDPSDASMHFYAQWSNCLYASPGYITEFREYTDADVSSMISKGVIYDMRDEYGNNMPYDFKNIVYNAWDENWGDVMVYTFSRIDASSGIVYDATLKPMDINITV